MSKLALCCAMVVLLAGSPVLADRKLRGLPFHLIHHLGKVHDKNAQPQPTSAPIVAAQPQILAPQPQFIVQQQHVMVPYLAATPQVPPVVAATPNVNPPPPSVQYVPVPTPVPTPVKEYIVKEKVVVKKVPVFVPVPVKHHHILPTIVGAVAKSFLHEMDNKQVNITVTDQYVPDASAPATTTTVVASAPAPAPMATAIPVPTFNATLAGMSG